MSNSPPQNLINPIFSNSISVGNSTVNTSINAIATFVGNSTSNSIVNSGAFSGISTMIGSNVYLANTGLYVYGGPTNGNSLVNSSAFYTGNSSVNAMMNPNLITLGSNISINTSAFFVGNSTVNAIVNSIAYLQGNSTVYVSGNSSADLFVGVGTNVSINSISVSIVNSTATAFIANTLGVYTGGTVNALSHTIGSIFIANTLALTLTTNTFTLGTANLVTTTSGANGYSTMPNGMKMMWGKTLTANTTAQIVTFSTTVGYAFTSNCFSVVATGNNSASPTYIPVVYSVNATAFTLITANQTASAVQWMAIGV